MFSPGGVIIPSGFYIKKALKHIIPFRLLSPCGIIFQGHDFDGNFRPVVGCTCMPAIWWHLVVSGGICWYLV